MKKVLAHVSALALVALPAVALAQSLNLGQLERSIESLTNVVNLVVGLLLAVEVVVFIWGVIRYILAPGPEAAESAKKYIIWSIIAITATLAVWGLAKLLLNIFGLRGDTSLQGNDIPKVRP